MILTLTAANPSFFHVYGQEAHLLWWISVLKRNVARWVTLVFEKQIKNVSLAPTLISEAMLFQSLFLRTTPQQHIFNGKVLSESTSLHCEHRVEQNFSKQTYHRRDTHRCVSKTFLKRLIKFKLWACYNARYSHALYWLPKLTNFLISWAELHVRLQALNTCFKMIRVNYILCKICTFNMSTK